VLAVRDAVTRLRLVPVMFEMGARPHPARRVYRDYLAQSEIAFPPGRDGIRSGLGIRQVHGRPARRGIRADQ
jgi:hypothetical protein